ncbi:hypothetical protein B0I33_104314 [Prauserella shujinwangii]|uniref:Uncharacterized protein n=1 Tax=Prauserella shujinwangii TaxID=1453103 RepID=A0A2T0LWW9_9PSEU|nr:hypothetical protein [Prauserella shujinwangii]PRX48497.1 hypothetical protein B0I33_104314 [Prauserella shujinwangii]
MGGVTQPAQRPPLGNGVSAGPASDAKTFVAAALLTFAAGMIVLIGYVMAGGFGGFLGLIGAVFAVVWWRSLHEKVFPRDLPAQSVVGLAVAAAVLFGLVVLMA